MQNSSLPDLPSLSSTHPINGDAEAQSVHNEGTRISNSTSRQLKRHTGFARKSNNHKAAQSAKQEIRLKLREDWDWPSLESPERSPVGHLPLNLPDSDSAWHERDSDSSFTPATNPYRYENPDAVAEPISSRKRWQHEQTVQEASWNEGLRHFMERRDAWTGAKASSPASSARNSVFDGPRSSSPGFQGAISTAAETEENQITDADLHIRSSTPISIHVPVAPPLLAPDNEVRAAITPATYPSIYSKVIIQGLTPTIPINLRDVVSAVVEGWKKDGEWPPKSEVDRLLANGDVELYGVKDGSRKLAKKGMGKVKKALGLGHDENGVDDVVEEQHG